MTWYPREMMRADILVSSGKKEAVVRELKESGIIHLINAKDTGLETSTISPNYSRISEFIHSIEDALDSFRLVEEKKGLITNLKNIVSPESVSRVKVSEERTERLLRKVEKKLPVIERARSIKEELKGLGERRGKLVEIEKTVSLLDLLALDPKTLSDHRFVSVSLGKMHEKDLAIATEDLKKVTKSHWMDTAHLHGEQELVVVAAPRRFEEEVSKVLNLNGFEPLKMPDEMIDVTLEQSKRRMRSELGTIINKETALKKELVRLETESKGELMVFLELLRIEKKLEESEMMFGKTQQTNLISCWVRSDKLKRLENTVKDSSRNVYTISSRKPKEDETPPTVLDNPEPATGLEIITKNYGLPSYNELDPTKFIALTFPLLFGMMFGDIGHGLMLLTVGLVLFKRFSGQTLGELGKILVVCGIAATFFGFLYGSAFGLTHENTPQMFQPIWMEPLGGEGKNITMFIKFSVTLALVTLSLGCVLNIINISRESMVKAFFHHWGVLGLWVLWAGAFMFFSHGIGFIPLIITGILGDAAALGTILPGLVIFLIPIVLLPIGEIFIEKEPVIIGLYDAFEVVQKFLVNTISYVRVVILAVVHGALLLMVLKVIEISTAGLSGVIGSFVSIFIFISGNVAIFGMEAMISFVQTIRLHYYELFSKFYHAGGKSFVPFKADRNYTVRRQKVGRD